MTKRTILIFIIGFSLLSCGPQKTVTEGGTANKASTGRVIKKYRQTTPDFKTLQARLKGSYDDGDNKQSISISMRIKKDDTIWLSAKLAGLFPLAKALITPNRVRYYDKINHEYFDGDFRLLSHWSGTSLDFDKVQNLLIARAIYPFDKHGVKLQKVTDGFQLSSKENAGIITSYMLDKSSFKLKGQQIRQTDKHSSITINYPDYQTVKGVDFPKTITMIVNQESDLTKINIRYRTLDIDTPVRFPFKTPSGYKELHL